MSGNTVVAGAPGFDNYRGATYAFVEPSSGWTDMTQTAELTVNDPIQPTLGDSVSISNSAIVAGAPSGRDGGIFAAY
ncbi:MAG: hypothetical protein ABSE92_07465, partial [Terriglobales bacterium]